MKKLFSFTNFLGLLVLLAAGAGYYFTQGVIGTQQLNLPGDLDPGGPRQIRLHFAKDNGEGLAVEQRTAQLLQGEDVLTRALAELMRGPQQQGATALVPAGTPAPTVFLREDTAIVDLPAAYARLNYGSAAETALIYGIAQTLLEFRQNPRVDQVRFLLQGREVESLGHLSLIDPFRRARQ